MANKERNEDNDHKGNGNIYFDIGASSTVIIAKLTELHNKKSTFQLLDQFTHDVPSNHHNVSYLRERWNYIVSKAKDMCPKTTKILKSAECISPQDANVISDEIQQTKVKMASDTIMLGAIASAAIILVQVQRLLEVWAAVKDAQNVVDESGTKINQINLNINQLNTLATELRGLIERYENETSSDQEKKRLMKSIKPKNRRMFTTYVDTRCMISELKLVVDGKKQVLAIYQREQISNGIMNTVNGFTNLIQYFQFSRLLSTGFMVLSLQGAITTAFFGLAIANAGMYCVTGKTLDQLRDALKQIDELEGQLRVILNTVHEVEDWVAANDE